MATIEDILNPIERNAWFYILEDEYYYINAFYVYPYDICNDDRIHKKDIYNNLKIKHYIKFGEECSICYEPIYSKPNAFLTDCGHCFHKTCISKWISIQNFNRDCPICRQNIGFTDFDRYVSNKGLDGLEEFELNKDIIFPEVCSYDVNHFIGMNKNCSNCMWWRKCI